MQSLKYTNFLLTVIALCLVYQCVKFGAPASVAQGGYGSTTAASTYTKPVPVQIVGNPVVKVEGIVKTETNITGMPKVDVVGISALTGRAGLPVEVVNQNGQYSQRPIEINTEKPLDVNLVGLSGDLPVEVKNSSLNVNVNEPVAVNIRDSNPIPVDMRNWPNPVLVSVTNFPNK